MIHQLHLTIADLLINLSAGWLGAIFIQPLSSNRIIKLKWITVVINFNFALICTVLSYKLRTLS